MQGSVAYDNNRNGIDVASASVVRDNIATLNGSCNDPSTTCSDTDGDGAPGPEHGIRAFANAWIVGNKSHENDGDGIRVSSTDTLVEGNSVTDNDRNGINVTATGSFVVRNKAAGNIVNYVINAGSSYGPIVNTAGGGNIAGIANSNHPQANFTY